MNRVIRILTLTALCVGCSPASSPYMLATTSALPTGGELATVVFLRPGMRPLDQLVTVVDERGGLVGLAAAEQYFVAQLEPGHHSFTTWMMDTSDLIEADLAPGRTYYVFLRTYGFGTFGVSSEVLHATGSEHANLARWLRELTRVERVAEPALAEAPDRLARARERFATYDAVHADAHTMRPDDGATN